MKGACRKCDQYTWLGHRAKCGVYEVPTETCEYEHMEKCSVCGRLRYKASVGDTRAGLHINSWDEGCATTVRRAEDADALALYEFLRRLLASDNEQDVNGGDLIDFIAELVAVPGVYAVEDLAALHNIVIEEV